MHIIARGAARGAATGALITVLICAAYAAQNFNTGLRLLDWLLGTVIISVPFIGLFVVLRVTSAVLIWFLARVYRRASGRASGVLGGAIGFLRIVGHPLSATSATIPWMVWLAAEDGPLAMYHSLFFFEIPIVVGTLVGLLVGLGAALYRVAPGMRPLRALALVSLALALVSGLGMTTWAVFPGFGDGLVHAAVESPAAVGRIAQLDLPNPSLPGPYRVALATYGSGTDNRRPEYGRDVDWQTPTIDASAALPDRGFPADAFAAWFWGHDDTRLPLNALVWYPTDAPGRLPLALIVHGNHAAGEFSDPGYAYLGTHLASHGIIAASVDQNYLNGDSLYDYGGQEMGVRAWLLLRHVELFAGFDATTSHPLAGRVDLERVALVGHSRGGEAATVAAMLSQRPQVAIKGLPATPGGFMIRSVVAIAPSDTMYQGPGKPVVIRDVDYLLLQGARDGDLPAFDGLAAYHRVQLSGDQDHFKAAVYSARSNHGRFNSVWDFGDAGAMSSWLLDRGSLLTSAEQEQLARAVIGAFLSRSLLNRVEYEAFFRDPRAGRAWLPDDVVQTHWQSARRSLAYDCARLDREAIDVTDFSVAKVADVPLRDGLTQSDRACLLTWTAPATLALSLAGAPTSPAPADGALVFSMVDTLESEAGADPLVRLTDRRGTMASLRLSDVAPARPLVPVQLWKAVGLGDRYAPQEKLRWPAERFAQTYELPLAAFMAQAPALDAGQLVTLEFVFDQPGSVYLDDVGFEGALPLTSAP